MEQIKAHIAVSLDGHTATPDYELDWMPREVKELVAREHAAASCLLMGANTYNYIFEHWGDRKSTRLNPSHPLSSRMPSSA